MSDDNRPGGPNQGTPDDLSARHPTGGGPTGGAPRTPDEWPQNQSRRRFLKAALISSAAGLAAGGATYAAIESVASTAPISSYTFIGNSGSPNAQSGSACTTNTGSEPDADDAGKGKSDAADYDPQTSFNQDEAIFVWAQFRNLPAGIYSFTATCTTKGGSGTTPLGTINCGAGQPFKYNGSGSSAVLYNLGKTNPTWPTCSPPTPGDLPTQVTAADTVPDLGSYHVTEAGDDLELRIHIKYDKYNHNSNPGGCTTTGDFTVTVNLVGPVNLSPTATFTIS